MTDVTTQSKPDRPLDTKRFGGNFLLFRKAGDSLKRGGGAGGIAEAKTHRVRPPRFRHPSFAAAEIEAGRLLDLMPDSTFVILQEVARVKLAAPQHLVDAAPAHVFEANAPSVRGKEAAHG